MFFEHTLRVFSLWEVSIQRTLGCGHIDSKNTLCLLSINSQTLETHGGLTRIILVDRIIWRSIHHKYTTIYSDHVHPAWTRELLHIEREKEGIQDYVWQNILTSQNASRRNLHLYMFIVWSRFVLADIFLPRASFVAYKRLWQRCDTPLVQKKHLLTYMNVWLCVCRLLPCGQIRDEAYCLQISFVSSICGIWITHEPQTTWRLLPCLTHYFFWV